MYIVGWKRLEPRNLVNNSPNLVLNKLFVKPDQWVNLIVVFLYRGHKGNTKIVTEVYVVF